MQFDHIDHSHKYIGDILYIIRLGLEKRVVNLIEKHEKV